MTVMSKYVAIGFDYDIGNVMAVVESEPDPKKIVQAFRKYGLTDYEIRDSAIYEVSREWRGRRLLKEAEGIYEKVRLCPECGEPLDGPSNSGKWSCPTDDCPVFSVKYAPRSDPGRPVQVIYGSEARTVVEE